LAVSDAASFASQRPPTPTVALVAADFAAFSGVHSGSSGPAKANCVQAASAIDNVINAVLFMLGPSVIDVLNSLVVLE
jgi:hypothetical protein